MKQFLLILPLAVLIGCGQSSTSVETTQDLGNNTSVTKDASGDVTKIQSGDASMNIGQNVDVKEPIYTGAKPITDGSKQGFSLSDTEGSVVSAYFRTDDPMDKVIEFYKNTWPKAQVIDVGSGKDRRCTVIAAQDAKINRQANISVDENGTSTVFEIVHGEKK